MIYDKKSFLPGNIEDPEFYQKVFDALPIPIFYRDLKDETDDYDAAFGGGSCGFGWFDGLLFRKSIRISGSGADKRRSEPAAF